MAADWYCEINGEQHGPVTSAQLRQLAVARKLHPSHPVWKEGMQKKVQARTVKGLFDVPPAEVVPVPGAPKRAAPAPKQEEELIEFEMVEPEEAEEVEELEFELVSPGDDRKKDKGRGKVREEKDQPPKAEKNKGSVAVASLKAATPTADKPFRVMSGGRVRGPYSLQEIRNLLIAGKIGDADLISVETWLPAATLAGFVEAGAGTGKRGGTAAKVTAEEEVEEQAEEADFDLVEAEEEVEAKAPVSRGDDDVIPVDDEFQLG